MDPVRAKVDRPELPSLLDRPVAHAPDPLDVPILIGVTGHRMLLPAAVPAIEGAVRGVLAALRSGLASRPGCLHVVTGLAEGADQLVAEIAAGLGIRLIAVSPMPLARYRLTLSTAAAQDKFDALWAQAALRLELPMLPDDVKPGETAEQAADRQDAAQYEQLALLLARQSHILLALWDGVDAEPVLSAVNTQASRLPGQPRRTRGGAPHVVGMRLNGERAEVDLRALCRTRLLAEPPSPLELARSGPVLQVVSPRNTAAAPEGRGGDGGQHAAGSLLWWSDIPPGPETPHPLWRLFWPPHDNHAAAPTARWTRVTAGALKHHIPLQLCEIVKLGPLLAAREAADPYACIRHAGHLCPPESLALLPAQEALGWLHRLFAAADVDAVHHQARVLGRWTPGLKWEIEKWWPPGALLWFALAVPVAAVCFELYAGTFHHDPHATSWVYLAAYLAILGGALLYYGAVVRRGRWQELQQDHRAFAEALRVQFFWALAGVPAAVSDNYLGQHADQLGWIRLALRGPALWSVAAALDVHEPEAELLGTRWIDDQRQFFHRRGNQDALAAVRVERCAHVTIFLLLAVAALQLYLHALGEGSHHAPLVIGGLTGLAAFWLIILEGRAYKEHAHTYRRAEALYRKAGEAAHDGTVNWSSLAVALGREALAENATWLEAHRSRPVASRTG